MSHLTRILTTLLAFLRRLWTRPTLVIDEPLPTLRLPRRRRATPCRQLLRTSGVTRLSNRPPKPANPWGTVESWWAPEPTRPSPTPTWENDNV